MPQFDPFVNEEQELYGEDKVNEAISSFFRKLEETRERANKSTDRVQDLLKTQKEFKKTREKEVYNDLIKSSFGFTPDTKAKKVAGKAAEFGGTLLGSLGLPIFGMGHSQKAKRQSESDYEQALKGALEDQKVASMEARATINPQEDFIAQLQKNRTQQRGQNIQAGIAGDRTKLAQRGLDLREQQVQSQVEANRYLNSQRKARELLDLAKIPGTEAASQLKKMEYELAQEVGIPMDLLKDDSLMHFFLTHKLENGGGSIKGSVDVEALQKLMGKNQGTGARPVLRNDGTRTYYDPELRETITKPAHRLFMLPGTQKSGFSGSYTQQGGLKLKQPGAGNEGMGAFADQVEKATGMDFGTDITGKKKGWIEIGNNPEEVKKFNALKGSAESLSQATGQLMNSLNSGNINEFKGLIPKYFENFRAAFGVTKNEELQSKLLESIASMKHLFATTPKSNPPIQLINSIKGAVHNPNDAPEVAAKRLMTQKLNIHAILGLRLKDPELLQEVHGKDKWDAFYRAMDKEIDLAYKQSQRHFKKEPGLDGKPSKRAVAPTIEMVLKRMKKDEEGEIGSREEYLRGR